MILEHGSHARTDIKSTRFVALGFLQQSATVSPSTPTSLTSPERHQHEGIRLHHRSPRWICVRTPQRSQGPRLRFHPLHGRPERCQWHLQDCFGTRSHRQSVMPCDISIESAFLNEPLWSIEVMLSMFETAWIESHANDLNCGDQDSVGMFFTRPSMRAKTIRSL
jgi:hypothetical protein